MRKLQMNQAVIMADLQRIYLDKANIFYTQFSSLKTFIISIIFTLITSFSTHAQLIPDRIFPDSSSNFLKTNVLQTQKSQQWTITFERRAPNFKNSHNFTIGYNNFRWKKGDSRKGIYLMYERRFYALPTFNEINFFIAPYGKVAYRDVYEKGGPIFRELNFRSISVVGGGIVGFQTLIDKRVLFGFNAGVGVGTVVTQKTYRGFSDADLYHLDGLYRLEFGYVF
jgi:hypothetical protein